MKKNQKGAGFWVLSRKERLGVLILTILVVFLFILPDLYPSDPGKGFAPDTTWVVTLKKTEEREKKKAGYQDRHSEPVFINHKELSRENSRLFPFDPNTLNQDGWNALGLREKTIRTILHFKEKGGRFRKPEDLKKIYGLFPDEFERLLPWIQISDPGNNTKTVYENSPAPVKKSLTREKKVIDINLADTSEWIALPGIGSKLAARIVLFREKLGGFYSTDQVAEVYALPDSVFQLIKPVLRLGEFSLKKISINEATFQELQAHPYLRRELAGPIIAYRKEHGPFKTIDELRRLQVFTEQSWTKLAPYIDIK